MRALKTTHAKMIVFSPGALVLAFLISAPAWMDLSLISLMTKILIFGLLAMSLDIVFGYVGLWSLCHAALFGVAAYTTGIFIDKLEITSFWIAAPAGIVAAAAVAALFAWIGLRMAGIYFLLITLALGQLIYSIVFMAKEITGGSDGIINIPYPDLGIQFSTQSFYYFTLTVVVLSALILYRLLRSPFGYSLQGIRENETRMLTLGFNTWKQKFLAFIVSGAFAGLAGVLYVHYNGIIMPQSVDMAASGLIAIMVIIGGSGTLWGGLIGSAVIYLLSYYTSIYLSQRWPLILGACFVAAVMFSRGGIYPYLQRQWHKWFQPGAGH